MEPYFVGVIDGNYLREISSLSNKFKRMFMVTGVGSGNPMGGGTMQSSQNEHTGYGKTVLKTVALGLLGILAAGLYGSYRDPALEIPPRNLLLYSPENPQKPFTVMQSGFGYCQYGRRIEGMDDVHHLAKVLNAKARDNLHSDVVKLFAKFSNDIGVLPWSSVPTQICPENYLHDKPEYESLYWANGDNLMSDIGGIPPTAFYNKALWGFGGRFERPFVTGVHTTKEANGEEISCVTTVFVAASGPKAHQLRACDSCRSEPRCGDVAWAGSEDSRQSVEGPVQGLVWAPETRS